MMNGSVSNCALLISTHRVGELLGVRLGDELVIQVALDPAQRGCGRADRWGGRCGAALSHAQQGGGSNSSARGAVTQFWFLVTQFGWRARELHETPHGSQNVEPSVTPSASSAP